jgi:hypothetical protein
VTQTMVGTRQHINLSPTLVRGGGGKRCWPSVRAVVASPTAGAVAGVLGAFRETPDGRAVVVMLCC